MKRNPQAFNIGDPVAVIPKTLQGEYFGVVEGKSGDRLLVNGQLVSCSRCYFAPTAELIQAETKAIQRRNGWAERDWNVIWRTPTRKRGAA